LRRAGGTSELSNEALAAPELAITAWSYVLAVTGTGILAANPATATAFTLNIQ
jgi:hypothetical protein